MQTLKEIIEGKSDIWWHQWWRDNAAALDKELGRTDYLKLKHGRLTAAAEYLKKNSVSFEWSQKGRLAETYSLLGDNLLDENGKLDFNKLDKHWGGAISLFHDGQVDKSMALFEDRLYQIIKSQDEITFGEMATGDILLQLGETDFALACWRTIINIQSDERFKDILLDFDEYYDAQVSFYIEFAEAEYEKRMSSGRT
ncbi:hypothetical protein [Leminorella grimontii]|uniref:hypothetical protein n=1 Tax=Leminorella grimontii TaxID=82981 RepID=UPI00321FD430